MVPDNEHGRPVLKWLLKTGRLVVGGQLDAELAKTPFAKTIIELDRAGRLKRIDANSINSTMKTLHEDGQLKSDDHHVIALAKISKCEIVFTLDKNLHRDLKNNKVLTPRPAIYQDRAHAKLFDHFECV